jgi:hypothetical protein
MCSEFYHRQWGKPGASRMKIPSSTWEHSIFKKAAPLIAKRIKVHRVHIPDWDDGEFVHDDGEESFGLFGLKYLVF